MWARPYHQGHTHMDHHSQLHPLPPEVTDTGLYPVLLSKNQGPREKRTWDSVLCVSSGPSSDSMGLPVWGSESEGSTEARHGLGWPGENSAWPECSLWGAQARRWGCSWRDWLRKGSLVSVERTPEEDHGLSVLHRAPLSLWSSSTFDYSHSCFWADCASSLQDL